MFPIQTKSRVYKVNVIETEPPLSVEQESSRLARFSSYKHLCFSVILFLNL